MTNDEAIKVIQERIDEILGNKKVQELMIALKRKGKTTEEIRREVTMLAIASLVIEKDD